MNRFQGFFFFFLIPNILFRNVLPSHLFLSSCSITLTLFSALKSARLLKTYKREDLFTGFEAGWVKRWIIYIQFKLRWHIWIEKHHFSKLSTPFSICWGKMEAQQEAGFYKEVRIQRSSCGALRIRGRSARSACSAHDLNTSPDPPVQSRYLTFIPAIVCYQCFFKYQNVMVSIWPLSSNCFSISNRLKWSDEVLTGGWWYQWTSKPCLLFLFEK